MGIQREWDHNINAVYFVLRKRSTPAMVQIVKSKMDNAVYKENISKKKEEIRKP